MSARIPSIPNSRWKGKQKQRVIRDEGDGGSDGILLSMDLVGDGLYEAVYTLPIRVGSKSQNLSLQVDTGSSDLWIASTSCSSSRCSGSARYYDPTGSTPTGKTFNIQYLLGSVSGPIVWDTIEVGGYSILNQAIAAANSISSEPLASLFDGILGLALPLNSVIAQNVPAGTSDSPDGAVFASNLFGITPTSSSPGYRFFSLTLARPGSDRLPSLLGIGKHPSTIITDPSRIHYSKLIPEAAGTYFWKVNVRAITVYTSTMVKPVTLGASNTGAVYPSAVLDTGVPYILTTSTVANGIYGAIGVGPGSDGRYYVPCNTPLNITITLDSGPEIPIHPLDLTAYPQTEASAEYCVGLIQTADSVLAVHNSNIGDMILGVAFLRNTYTVLAYEQPYSNGTFPPSNSPQANESDETDASSISLGIKPRLGLLGLTDPTTALDEFNTVRVLNQPLPSTSQSGSSTPTTTSSGGKKLSVGIEVLIGLLGFFAVCVLLFGLWWFSMKRRLREHAAGTKDLRYQKNNLGEYELTRRGSQSSQDGLPSEETLRTIRYQKYVKERMLSQYTMSSGRTRVDLDGVDDDMGYKRKSGFDAMDIPDARPEDPWDPESGLDWGDTNPNAVTEMAAPGVSNKSNDSHERPPPSPPQTPTTSDIGSPRSGPTHDRGPSISIPLLAHTRNNSRDNSNPDDLAEFGLANSSSMAGIGTAARGSIIDSARRHSRINSVGSVSESLMSQSRARTTRSPRPTSSSQSPPPDFAS